MEVETLAARAVAAVGGEASADTSFGQVTIDVPPEQWTAAARSLRDHAELACEFFDWLSSYDDGDAGLAVVAHVWSVRHRHHLLLRTRVPRETARLASLTAVWAGANWHERETFEMFGITFDGHPNLVSLLLPEGFEGNPLRKEFVLASRVAKAWPGAKEPGESDRDTGAPGRRRMLPPGVPDPAVWGPDATSGDGE